MNQTRRSAFSFVLDLGAFALAIVSSLPALVEAENVYCIGHRGYNAKYLENSLESIRQAVWAGADGIEIDIRHTQDDVAIVMHDDDMDRTAQNVPEKRCPLYADISNVSSTVLDRCRLKNGEPIPTLQSALELITSDLLACNPNLMLFLELKDSPSKETVRLLEDFFGQMPGQLKIIAFSNPVLESFCKTATDNKNNICMSEHYDLAGRDLMGDDWGYLDNFTAENIKLRGTGGLFKAAFGRSMADVKSHITEDTSLTAVWTVNSETDMEHNLFAHYYLEPRQMPLYVTTDNPGKCVEYRWAAWRKRHPAN